MSEQNEKTSINVTPGFERAIRSAQLVCSTEGHTQVDLEHVLWSLLKMSPPDKATETILTTLGVSKDNLLVLLEGALSNKIKLKGVKTPPFGSDVLALFALSQEEGVGSIGAAYFWRTAGKVNAEVRTMLASVGFDQARADEFFKVMDGPTRKSPNFTNASRSGGPEASSGEQFIKQFCVDLTARAAEGKIDPVIGRDEETRSVIEILSRRTKNNPVVVGEPGVGKTAIVEGLAQRIIKGEVPETMKGVRLMALDMSSLVAGAKYKGEFEERLKGLIKEIQSSSDEMVLFIDEMHTLIGVGQGGGMDAANLLKPALARGELRCIGATTLDEYQKYIEKDPALERRFQRVLAEEPSQEDTIAILRGLKEKYAAHHKVEITDSAIVSAVELSSRYMPDRRLPDKAIDLLDGAAARVRMVLDSKPEEIDRLERRVVQLRLQEEALKKEEEKDAVRRRETIGGEIAKLKQELAGKMEIWMSEKARVDYLAEVKKKIEGMKQDIEIYKRKGDLGAASELEYGRLPQLQKEVREVQAKQASAKNLVPERVTAEQVSEVLSKLTGIPVAKMVEGERDRLMKMEAELGTRLIGQKPAVEAVSDAIRRSRAGMSDPKKPVGSFLFSGPSGVGKTELVKALSNFLFETEDSIIRLDMSEFAEKQSVARLIGAPPGYVGYEEGGVLTEAVRRKPYSIILLDEVEKAHVEVFDILLQVLDDGRLTDGQGRVVDFKNTIVIMTSNLGSEQIQVLAGAQADYETIKEAAMESIEDHFRPEFINRIDEIVVFHPLKMEHIQDIAKIRLKGVIKRAEAQGFQLEFTPDAMAWICEKGFDPQYGARPLNRVIEKAVKNPLSKKIIRGEIPEEGCVVVKVENGDLFFDAKPLASVVENPSNVATAQASVADVVVEVPLRPTRKTKASVAKIEGGEGGSPRL